MLIIKLSRFQLWITLVFEITGTQESQECQDALGMENSAISDGQITASSFHTHSWIDHGPYLARLHLQHISDVRAGGWLAALPNDASQWLQIDLGNRHYNVTRVATQGRQSSDQKVTKYKLQYSDDGVAFSWYENDQGQPKDFAGNIGDANDVVSYDLNPPIRAQYIRFLPVTWDNYISMRVELYGCIQGCQQALGMANGAITDEQISASSEYDPTTHSLKFGRLFYTLNSGAWVAKGFDDSQWIQIDLGRNNIKVTLVATQGRANDGQWVTSYKLQQSNDGANFKYYREAGKPEDKVFTGNTDQNTIKSHELNPPIRSRYIRFRPVTWNGAISMRVELYGCAQECHHALGMESGLISDAQVSASSEYSDLYAATNGRLNNSPKPWVPASSDADQWLKIDVLGMGRKYVRVTGIATQGRYHLTVSQWVTKYKVKYSDDDATWQFYKQHGQNSVKEFAGNFDKETVVHHDLNPPIKARYVMFRPVTWNGHLAMRVELYGCTKECASPSIGIEKGKILNSQMTASSGDASLGRLKGRFAWCPSSDALNEYIQVDMGGKFRVCAVATQGSPGEQKRFVKEYKLRWSNDNVNWDTSSEVLTGNTNWRDIIKNYVPIIYARYVRLYPIQWYGSRGCMRIEIYGELWPEVPATLFSPIGCSPALHNQVISSINTTQTGIDCFKLCLVTEQCKSFKFNNPMQRCEVFSSTTELQSGVELEEGFSCYEPTSHQKISP